jgi:putative nucleotidyltransferase with HDIG domain
MNKGNNDVDILDAGYPLLVEFKEHALGSYTHSRHVSDILETLGNELGLNSRNLKVAGMYHDIGKMHNPLVFSENQPDDNNVHDQLDPWVSFALISAHVARTVQILFNDNNFSDEVIALCAQHHGTTLASYFAKKDIEAPETEYRYRGKRPQSFDASLVMLCDHLEARIRSEMNSGRLKDKEGIEELVEVVFDTLVEDDQFDEVAVPSFKMVRKLKLLLKKEFTELFSDYKRIDYKENKKKGSDEDKE